VGERGGSTPLVDVSAARQYTSVGVITGAWPAQRAATQSQIATATHLREAVHVELPAA